jgi:inosine-uridine nucleoside N-ribohydrolase
VLACIKINIAHKLLMVLITCGLIFSFANNSNCANSRPLLIDHDAGIDDFISCTLQLLYVPERVKAITIAPADSFRAPAVIVMKRLMYLLLADKMQIPLGASKNQGRNPFPDAW